MFINLYQCKVCKTIKNFPVMSTLIPSFVPCKCSNGIEGKNEFEYIGATEINYKVNVDII